MRELLSKRLVEATFVQPPFSVLRKWSKLLNLQHCQLDLNRRQVLRRSKTLSAGGLVSGAIFVGFATKMCATESFRRRKHMQFRKLVAEKAIDVRRSKNGKEQRLTQTLTP